MQKSDSIISIFIKAPVPSNGVSQILYAAAFIDSAIETVEIEEGIWRFDLKDDVDEVRLESGLNVLIDRFSSAQEFKSDPIFSYKGEGNKDGDNIQKILNDKSFVVSRHQGLNIYKEPISSIVRFLDDTALQEFAAPYNASEELYPNCISLQDLSKAHHLSSFPEHLHFLTHLTQDLDVLDNYAAGISQNKISPQQNSTSKIELVQNPSTCYHCYASRAGENVSEDTVVTAITKCHRFEAGNHKDFGRLLEFSLREVVFLGTPEFVREKRLDTLERIKKLVTDWEMTGELISSNDPFFTSDYENKAKHQQRMAMKYEYRMEIPGETKKISVLSSNLHGHTFSKSFGFNRDKRLLHSGCLGFGLERWALALIAQHGIDPLKWPAKLSQQYMNWKTVDPLTAT